MMRAGGGDARPGVPPLPLRSGPGAAHLPRQLAQQTRYRLPAGQPCTVAQLKHERARHPQHVRLPAPLQELPQLRAAAVDLVATHHILLTGLVQRPDHQPPPTPPGGHAQPLDHEPTQPGPSPPRRPTPTDSTAAGYGSEPGPRRTARSSTRCVSANHRPAPRCTPRPAARPASARNTAAAAWSGVDLTRALPAIFAA